MISIPLKVEAPNEGWTLTLRHLKVSLGKRPIRLTKHTKESLTDFWGGGGQLGKASVNKGRFLQKRTSRKFLGKGEWEPLSNEATEGRSSSCLLRQ